MQLINELDYLKQMLLKMADAVQNNILNAFRVLQKEKAVYDINDEIVDRYEHLIDEICLNIMIKERPYARDLRLVSGILKLVADLERIGDHAEDIMNFNMKLKDIDIEQLPEVDEMVKYALEMVKNAIDSFIKMDLALAHSVIEEDDKIFIEVILKFSQELPKTKEYLAFMIFTTLVVKYIERIADHAVNIAEWVIYIINGYHKDKKIF